MLNKILMQVFTKSYFKSKVYDIVWVMGKWSNGAYRYSDDMIRMSSRDRHAIGDYSEVTCIYLKMDGEEELVYHSIGHALHCFREGAWIDYLDGLHEKAMLERNERRKEQRKKNALKFSPIDDSDVFGKKDC